MLTLFITMFYSLASILFPTLARKTSKHSHFDPLNVFLSNTSGTESHLSLAHNTEIDMASLTIFTSKYHIYFRLKRLCLKVYAEGTKSTVCFLKPAFSGNLQWRLCKINGSVSTKQFLRLTCNIHLVSTAR